MTWWDVRQTLQRLFTCTNTRLQQAKEAAIIPSTAKTPCKTPWMTPWPIMHQGKKENGNFSIGSKRMKISAHGNQASKDQRWKSMPGKKFCVSSVWNKVKMRWRAVNDVKCYRMMSSVNGDPTSQGNKPRVRCADDGEVTRKSPKKWWQTENKIPILVIKKTLEGFRNCIVETKLRLKQWRRREETHSSKTSSVSILRKNLASLMEKMMLGRRRMLQPPRPNQNVFWNTNIRQTAIKTSPLQWMNFMCSPKGVSTVCKIFTSCSKLFRQSNAHMILYANQIWNYEYWSL